MLIHSMNSGIEQPMLDVHGIQLDKSAGKARLESQVCLSAVYNLNTTHL